VATREERLAQNEVRFREINESAQPQRESQGTGRFVCECADRSCMAWLEVPLEAYSAVRQNPRRFLVLPTHEIPDLESIVAREAGYFVIEKPEAVAHIVE
jgi:hypothetical protein